MGKMIPIEEVTAFILNQSGNTMLKAYLDHFDQDGAEVKRLLDENLEAAEAFPQKVSNKPGAPDSMAAFGLVTNVLADRAWEPDQKKRADRVAGRIFD